jgi:4-diphosphocytidyl-2-C-methyl-D-erythritol kinase
MIIFPPAKVNLGLDVLFKREDGYHELETCMVAIPFTDILEIVPAEEFTFKQTGLVIASSSEDNLCVKAYRLMVEHFSIPPVYLHLRKMIPMGAGLGGGSADAAYVLRGIRDLFSLDVSNDELEKLAATLGSDCPFFITDSPKIAKGRGEVLSDCPLDLKGYWIKLINPGIHVGTKEAYSGIVFGNQKHSVKEIVEGPIENWKAALKNDFETSVFGLHPKLAEIKEDLYAEGVVYAAMSGSGSTMFGIYKCEPSLTFSNEADYLEVIKRFE